MPVVKGGVWTNIEDEILKASVSKYGLNQWARVSSLLARKTPKQCKARWTEWLDPGIRKIEWSKEEDEKLLHLAKLMPTQWRTIAPIVGRTATQCLERYQKLLDEAEARENDELGLGGPGGGETSAPTGDQVRKLRPGELDPDPESKPARPDTIDLDEDEKEMLSEARARLANTQGKKAKRKARERQLEESRRLAVLQKRRELKNAGINIKITTRKKGEMDYNADIPFEKQAAPGFHDTLDEEAKNERERELFDPRKQQLARKRQGDPEDNVDSKRQKQDKGKDSSAMAAAARAGQMQRLREAEQQSKRRTLNLPAPQVSEGELEEIVKMGMAGDRAIKAAGEEDGGDRGLISNYTNMVGATPIRTPRAPAQEDHIANEIRNIRALTETQSSLLGGENTPLHEGSSSTGFDGIAPRRNEMVTPNPMATPLRQGGVGASLPGATPLRTPRDNLTINEQIAGQLVPQTPRDIRQAENLARNSLRAKLASLPQPKESEWELEILPSEQEEVAAGASNDIQEDQEEIDRRRRQAEEAATAAEFKRQTQVFQRGLPRPTAVNYNSLASEAVSIADPIRAMIAQQAAILMAHDVRKHPLTGSKVTGKPPQLDTLPDDLLANARQQLKEACNETERQAYVEAVQSLASPENERDALPLKFTMNTTPQEYLSAFRHAQTNLLSSAEAGQKLEEKLNVTMRGYQVRQKTLKQKVAAAYAQIGEQRAQLDSFKTLQIGEEGALARRLERLRDEVSFVARREREAQEDYRAARDELGALRDRLAAGVNGVNGHG
jgi:pre-mRNA-splicing factor CDC5/CEF1